MANEIITPELTAILTQRTPPNVIRYRPGPSGKILSYVEHAWVTEQLNLAFAWQWSWEVLEWKLLPNADEPTEAFVLGRLTIHAKTDIVKTQFGSSDIKRDRNGKILSIGDDLKAASSDALKKCASLLGLALDLYKSEDDDSANSKTKTKTKTKTNGNAKSDPMTAYWIAARERGLTTEQGRDLLAKAGGDPVKAIELLLEQ